MSVNPKLLLYPSPPIFLLVILSLFSMSVSVFLLCQESIIWHHFLDSTYRWCWASLIAQLVRNPPAMQETPIGFLGQEDPLGKGWATQSSTLGLPWWLSR